jgi:hypothetical protein
MGAATVGVMSWHYEMKSRVIVMGALALASCASRLQWDLGSAERPCHRQDFKEKTALVQCLAAAERPVWAKDEPQTLDLYDQFATGRAELAKERDAGTVSEHEYETRLGALAREFRAKIAERRKASD